MMIFAAVRNQKKVITLQQIGDKLKI